MRETYALVDVVTAQRMGNGLSGVPVVGDGKQTRPSQSAMGSLLSLGATLRSIGADRNPTRFLVTRRSVPRGLAQ